jgi:hypothetical protein
MHCTRLPPDGNARINYGCGSFVREPGSDDDVDDWKSTWRGWSTWNG